MASSICTVDYRTSLSNFQRFAEQLDDPERNGFFDAQVKVETKVFNCHRFILSASSDYFNALFSSEMKESKTKIVELKEFSASDFQNIFDFIYRSKRILNDKNIINIWHAANRLQMPILLRECEMFLETSYLQKERYDRFVEVYNNAELLESPKLSSLCFDLMVTSFQSLVLSDAFYMLNANTLLKLLSFEQIDLNVDIVVEKIVMWTTFNGIEHNVLKSSQLDSSAEHKQSESDSFCKTFASTLDEKENALADLLVAARICFAPKSYLGLLLGHDAVIENKNALKNVKEALQYQTMFTSGQTFIPKSAMFKAISSKVNCVFSIAFQRLVESGLKKNTLIIVARTQDGTRFRILKENISTNRLQSAVSFKNKLIFTAGDASGKSWLYDMNNNVLTQIGEFIFDRENHSLTIAGNYVYAIGGKECLQIERMQIENIQTPVNSQTWEKTNGFLITEVNNFLTVSFDQYIIIFSSESEKSEDISIQSLNTETMQAFQYEDRLQGNVKHMVHFRHFKSLYLLQKSGCLYEIQYADKQDIIIKYIDSLWQQEVAMKSAVLWDRTLMVFGKPSDEEMSFEFNFSGPVFSKVLIIDEEDDIFVHGVTEKKFLNEKLN